LLLSFEMIGTGSMQVAQTQTVRGEVIE